MSLAALRKTISNEEKELLFDLLSKIDIESFEEAPLPLTLSVLGMSKQESTKFIKEMSPKKQKEIDDTM